MENKPVRVVIIDDHPIVRAGLHNILYDVAEIQIVGEGTNGQEALLLVEKLRPDVLVLDVNLPDINGLEVTRRMRASGDATAVLILTVHNDNQMVFGLLKAGATGYVLKDDTLETLAPAIQAVAHGETWLSSRITNHVVERALEERKPPDVQVPSPGLTRREMEVVCLLALGLDNEEIAEKLTLTMRTVQNHVSTIYSKLEVDSRAEAILYAIRRGWVQVPQEKDSKDEY